MEITGSKNYDIFISYVPENSDWVHGFFIEALSRAGVTYCEIGSFQPGANLLDEFEQAVKTSRLTVLVLSNDYLHQRLIQQLSTLADTHFLIKGDIYVVPLLLEPDLEIPLRHQAKVVLEAYNDEKQKEAVERLCASLNRSLPAERVTLPCPYPGMKPFQGDSSHPFFGRDSEIAQIDKKLNSHNFLAVIGASGSGKSSLINAGLIPFLQEKYTGSQSWHILSMQPGSAPLDKLQNTLGEQEQPAGPLRLPAKTLLFIDQFEEIFTLETSQAEAFQKEIVHLVNEKILTVLITVRSDFYADIIEGPLFQQIVDHRLEIQKLDRDALSEAIQKPARRLGVYVQRELVDALVEDADGGGQGILPFLQETLVLLWGRMDQKFLSLDRYREVAALFHPDKNGQVTGLQAVLAFHADEAFFQLTQDEQKIAQRSLLRLIQFGQGRSDTRRQQTESSLRSAGDDPEKMRRFLTVFESNRLISLSGDEKSDRLVELTHDSLITGWPRLSAFVKSFREAEQTRRKLEEQAEFWDQTGRKDDALLNKAMLAVAETWQESPEAKVLGPSERLVSLIAKSRAELNAKEQERVEALQREVVLRDSLLETQNKELESRNQREKEQKKSIVRLAFAFGVAVLGVIISVAFGVSFLKQRDLAVKESRRANANKLAAQSLAKLDDQFDLALLLSAAAYQVDSSGQAVGSLLSASGYNPRLKRFLFGCQGTVDAVQFHPDGKTVAAACYPTGVLLWNIADANQKEPEIIKHEKVTSLAFRPDGAVLAVGDANSNIQLLDVAARKVEINMPGTGNQGPVLALAFSPDGKFLATGGEDGIIHLWNATGGYSQVWAVPVPTGRINSLSFDSHSNLLASGGENATVVLLDVKEGKLLQRLEGHTGPVFSVAFQPDGDLLASASKDSTIRLWSLNSDRLAVQPLQDHHKPVTAVVFSPDGQYLASSGADFAVRLWNLEDLKVVGAEKDQLVKSLASESYTSHRATVNALTFSPDGKFLVTGSQDGSLVLWDLAAQPDLSLNRQVDAVAVSKDDLWMALGTCPTPQPYEPCSDPEIMVKDTTQPEKDGRRLRLPVGTLTALAFSPDGKILASGSTDHTIRLWDVEGGTQISQTPAGIDSDASSLSFSYDGRFLAAAYEGGSPRVWEIIQGKFSGKRSESSAGGVVQVAFSPTSNLLAMGNKKGVVIFSRPEQIEQKTSSSVLPVIIPSGMDRPVSFFTNGSSRIGWRTIETLQESHIGKITSFAFSTDGEILASGDENHRIVLWDTTSLQQIGQPIDDQTQAVTSLAFQPEGDWLASGSEDGSIWLWNVRSREWLGQIRVPIPNNVDDPGILHLAFLAGGKTLTAAWRNGMVLTRSVDPAALQQQVCIRAGRDFTSTEVDNYFNNEMVTKTCGKLSSQ